MATTAVEKDPVVTSLTRAIRAVRRVQQAAYDDTRTNGTIFTDHLDGAGACLKAAERWMAELVEEQQADLKPEKPTEVEETTCHICGEEKTGAELAKCSGCDEDTCGDCMGDNEVCIECEEEG